MFITNVLRIDPEGLEELINKIRTEPMLDQKNETLTLTVPEAAKLLRISRSAAYESVRTGSIPAIRFGRTIRIPRYALERLLAGCGKDSKEETTGI